MFTLIFKREHKALLKEAHKARTMQNSGGQCHHCSNPSQLFCFEIQVGGEAESCKLCLLIGIGSNALQYGQVQSGRRRFNNFFLVGFGCTKSFALQRLWISRNTFLHWQCWCRGHRHWILKRSKKQ